MPKATEAQATTDAPKSPEEPVRIAGDYYAELITEQLADERARRESFERRALAVVTTSGVIMSVLLGFAALVSDAAEEPSRLARYSFVFALVLFGAAVSCGIVGNIPRRYEEARAEHLRPLLEKRYWFGRPSVGNQRTAELRLGVLEWAQGVNDGRGGLLIAALILELLGLAAAAFAVGAVVLD